MAVSVAGLNIKIGFDTAQLEKGIKASEDRIRSFKDKIKNIKLDASIKGNPLAKTEEYFKAADKTINKIFQSWKNTVKSADFSIDKQMDKSKKSIDALSDSWLKLQKIMKNSASALDMVSKKGLFSYEQAAAGIKTGADGSIGIKNFVTDVNAFSRALRKLAKDAPQSADDIHTWLKRFSKNIKVDKEAAKMEFDAIANIIKNAQKEIGVTTKQFGATLQTAMLKQSGLDYANQVKRAKDVSIALAKNRDEVKKLIVRERELRTEISQGILVNQKRVQLAAVMQERLDRGAKLTARQRKELALLNKEIKKQEQASKTTFLSPEWFKYRAKWFIELRLLWEVYRIVGDAARDLVEYEDQLARAMRTANSEVMSRTETMEAYGEAMRNAAAITGAGWSDIGEVLYQLGSAGLSAEESIAGLNHVLALNTALEGEVVSVTKLVASLYNNFGESMTDFVTKEEKMAHITDVITTLWKHHQFELNEMVDAFKYSSNVAQAAGISFENLGSIMAVLHDHLIRGGRAGRSFQAILSRIARSPAEFAHVFGIGIEGGEPLKIEEIFETLHGRLQQGAVSVDELSAAFERLGLRGAPTFITLVKHWNEVGEAQKEVAEGVGSTFDVLEERMDSFTRQWDRFLNTLKQGYLSILAPILHELTGVFKGISDTVVNVQSKILMNKISDPNVSNADKLKMLSQTDLGTLNQIADKLEKQIEYDKTHKKQSPMSGVLKWLSVGPNPVIGAGMMGFKELFKVQSDEEALKALNDIRELARSRSIQEGSKLGVRDMHGMISGISTTPLSTEKQTFESTSLKLALADPRVSGQERISAINARLNELRKQEEKVRTDLKAAQDSGIRQRVAAQEENLLKILKKESELEREKNQIVKARVDIENAERKAREKALKDDLKVSKDTHEATKEELNYKIKSDQFDREGLRSQKYTVDNYEAIKTKTDQIYKIKLKVAAEDYIINSLSGEMTDQQAKRIQLEQENAALSEKIKNNLQDRVKYEAELFKIIDRRAEKKTLELEKEKVLAEINNESRERILELEEETLLVTKESLEAKIKATESDELRYQLANDLKKVELDILKVYEKQKRARDPLYDATQRLKSEQKDSNQVFSDAIYQGATSTVSGITNFLFEATGGFQTNKQAVAELEAEYSSLKEELGEVNKEMEEAIEEGDTDRVEELKEQTRELKENMAALRDEIDRVDDPLENLKSSFASFFKDLADAIRKAILNWIAMKIVMGLMDSVSGLFSFGSGSSGSMAGVSTSTPMGYSLSMIAGTGGILPNVKSFRSFSSGGMTGDPTLALLGDNPSKKELVIPSENIEKNKVSGYTREKEEEEKQPINIINVLTKEDIADAMSAPAGERVIMNMIGKDMSRGGPIYRQMKA